MESGIVASACGSTTPVALLPALAAIQLMLAVALAALTALHIYLTVLNSRQVRRYLQANANQQNFNGLVNESVAYATRTNPALLPALAAAGLGSPPSNPPALPRFKPTGARNRSTPCPNHE